MYSALHCRKYFLDNKKFISGRSEHGLETSLWKLNGEKQRNKFQLDGNLGGGEHHLVAIRLNLEIRRRVISL